MKGYLSMLSIFVSLFAYAQNEAFSSYYMLNPTNIQPAWVGFDPIASVSLQVRNQWTGYTSSFDGSGGAPNTQIITTSIPIRGSLSGVGLSIVNDNLGPVNNLQVNIPIAYNIRLSKGILSMSIMPGIYSKTQKFDELRFNDPSDPFNIGTRENHSSFNVGMGLLFATSRNLFYGVSTNNIFEPGFDFNLDSLQNKLSRSYSFLGGWKKNVSKNLILSPSLIMRTDFFSFTFDASVLMSINEKAWGGLSYRYSEAIIFIVGYSLLQGNRLKVGYAMDLVVDEKSAKQRTSQEIFLRYNLPDLVIGGKKQIKTPRFTY